MLASVCYLTEGEIKPMTLLPLPPCAGMTGICHHAQCFSVVKSVRYTDFEEIKPWELNHYIKTL